MLWEFSRISVACSRFLDRNGRGMLLQSVSVSITEYLRHAENEKCSVHLVLSKIKLLLRLASSFVI